MKDDSELDYMDLIFVLSQDQAVGRLGLRSEEVAGWDSIFLREELQEKGREVLTEFNLRPICKLIAKGEKKSKQRL